MRSDRLGGTAMIVGALMGIVTMAFHPTGHDVAGDPHFQGALNVAVHSLAIASLPVVFYGALVLTRRLSASSDVAWLALAFQGAACVAAIMAATASGFLTPQFIERATTSTGAEQVAARAVLDYCIGMNQAFAKIFVAGSSIAIGLWSLEIARAGAVRRPVGIYGCIVTVLTLVMLFSGHLRLDVHGFGAVVLGQAVWLIWIGIELRRARVST